MNKKKTEENTLLRAINTGLYDTIKLLRQTELRKTLEFAEDTYVIFESELRHMTEISDL